MAELTEKQKRFADYYIESGNATEAARKAGYSEKTAKVIGSENMTKPAVRVYIDERIKAKDNDRIASQDEVLAFLSSVMRGDVTEKVPMFVGNGIQELTENLPAVHVREKAAELLGKRYMLWTDKHQVDGTIGVRVVDDV